MNNVGVFAASLDPITKGHVALIKQGCRIFDLLYVAIGYNPSKNGFFTPAEKGQLADLVLSSSLLPEEYERIKIVFVQDELLVNFAAGVGAKYIIRGLRGLADFEKEYEMCQINRLINPEVQTLYLIAPPEFAQVSSSTVRELAIFKGSDEALKKFAHEIVIQAVRDKIESKRAKQQG